MHKAIQHKKRNLYEHWSGIRKLRQEALFSRLIIHCKPICVHYSMHQTRQHYSQQYCSILRCEILNAMHMQSCCSENQYCFYTTLKRLHHYHSIVLFLLCLSMLKTADYIKYILLLINVAACLAMGIYTNSTHQCVFGVVNTTKDDHQTSAPVA